ncbi:MAG: DUF3846 domain-containing protein [Oribacterium sp.]|nr:DUF3846 domain-containing protein [Oribacterium sp.]
MKNSEGGLFAVRITVDDEIETIPYPKKTPDQLDELHWMQKQVDGHIQVIDDIRTGRNTAMIINEDGKFQGLPHNDIAQALWFNEFDYLVGNVVIVSSIGEELSGMTAEEAQKVELIARAMKEKLGKY